MDINTAIRAAVKNVAGHGDTDIFPYPFENLIFNDREQEICALIAEIHRNFPDWLANYPLQTIPSLSQVGYTGFRWATLIDPIWNVYYLALVIWLGEKIESQRISEEDQTVFSYRFSWSDQTAKLFKDSTWRDFRARCLELSQNYPVVVQTDIADFYPRIYHHRIENALNRLPVPGDAPRRIMDLLNAFSKNVSYGLPVGGPASRIISELALDGVDKLLIRKGVRFCRYADDYAIFCADRSEAYRTLVFLSEKLANEGLVLQKKKTRIISSEEFRHTSQLLDPTETNARIATEEQKLLNISIYYDPYSLTADEDYEDLKEAVNQVDIIGILGRELSKSTIDQTVSRQAIQAIAVLSTQQREEALLMLLDHDNLLTLAPVFVTVMRVVRDSHSECSNEAQVTIDEILCDLWSLNSPLLSVEVNLAYYVQTLVLRGI